MNASGTRRSSASEAQAAGERWAWLLAAGILALILGLVALSATVTTTVISTFLLGIVLLVGSIAEAVHAFKSGGGAGLVVLRLLMALLFLLGGLGLIFRPLLGAATLTLMMALFFLASGVAAIVIGLFGRGENWGLSVATGALGVILGILLLAHWPLSGLYAIGLFVALYLIVSGISWIASALMSRSAQPMLAQPAG